MRHSHQLIVTLYTLYTLSIHLSDYLSVHNQLFEGRAVAEKRVFIQGTQYSVLYCVLYTGFHYFLPRAYAAYFS